MELLIPDQLPQLAQGGHEVATGKACIMNAISYINGDKKITDMPNCVYGPLAYVAQIINDTICDGHAVRTADGDHLLCAKHSHMVWLLGARLIGTGEAARNLLGKNPWNHARLAVRLALWTANQLPPAAHLDAAKASIQQWLDEKVTIKALKQLYPDHSCYHGDHGRKDDAACSAIQATLGAVLHSGSSAPERTGRAQDAIATVARSFLNDEQPMEFVYKLLAEFDRITGKDDLHQWTADEFAIVHDRGLVPLISVTA